MTQMRVISRKKTRRRNKRRAVTAGRARTTKTGKASTSEVRR